MVEIGNAYSQTFDVIINTIHPMNDYTQVTFTVTPAEEMATDILAAMLAEVGYESFVPDAEGMTAYVPHNSYDAEALAQVVADFPLENYRITYATEKIEGEDWNAEWEKNYFQPIVVGNECVIHSTFHTNIPQARYDILIDPKMAFGTGHHQTTSLMLRAILASDMTGKRVLDMGCGTALLAILARKCGATQVTGIDIDEFAYENALENIRLNDTSDIDIRLGGVDALKDGECFDFILANINRNILLADMAAYAAHLHSGASIFMSGFYLEDMDILKEEATHCGLRFERYAEDNRWTMMQFVKE